MSIDRLAMSATCRCRSSAFRIPVAYSSIRIVRSVRVRAASIKRAMSSVVKIVGKRRGGLRVRQVILATRTLQRLDEEEPQRRDVDLDRARAEVPFLEQIGLIRAQVGLIQSVRRLPKVPRKPGNRADVSLHGRRGVVATLEFLQHRLSERSHTHLLVTHTLTERPHVPHAERPSRQRLRSNAVMLL